MIVEPSHRTETIPYPPETYQELADRIVDGVSKVEPVKSIVVCGSLIKDTLVPGWSDLDFVFFMDRIANSFASLNALRSAVVEAKGETQIGIGIDLVFKDLFKEQKRLGGRPLAMTFEVAGYGKTLFGPNPFRGLQIDDRLKSLIEYDRKQAIRAELHNWRRSFLLQKGTDAHWLSRCAKTVLKLLKHETDPNLLGPYTYDAALALAVQRAFPDNKLKLFSAAVDCRLQWLSICRDERATADKVSFFETGIADYREDS